MRQTHHLTSSIATLIAIAMTVSCFGCGDRNLPKDKSKYKTVFTVPPKLKKPLVQAAPTPKPAEPEKPKVQTWVTKIKPVIAEIQQDLIRCRNEFMLPFQFKTGTMVVRNLLLIPEPPPPLLLSHG